MTTLSFSLIVPPLWTRFDLTRDVEAELADVSRALVRQVSLTRQPLMRKVLEEQVSPAVRELAAKGADCALLAVDPYDPSPLRPVAYFSTTTLDAEIVGDAVGAAPVLAQLSAEQPDADVRAFGELVALRTHRVVDSSAEFAAVAEPVLASMRASDQVAGAAAASADAPAELATTVADSSHPAERAGDGNEPAILTAHVRYVIGSQNDVTRWLTSELSVQYPDTPEGAEVADSVIGLYDAVVSTVRWDS